MSHFVVAMVTKKTQILFFTLIFQWLKCSYSLPVVGVLFKVVLNEGKIISNILTLKSTKFACFSGKWEPKTWNMSAHICPKIINMAAILEFSAAILEFCRYFGGIVLLENVAPSHNLILNCKIPSNSIKQGMFILPAKFKPYFYTHACKWIGFSKILPHISLSLIKMARNPT